MNTQTIKKLATTFARSIWFGPTMLVICFVFLLGVRVAVDLPTMGDEPHYLLTDYSLIHDHDLNLKNNYLNHDYAAWFPDQLPPQGSSLNVPVVTSIHGNGLPFFLLPGFAIAQKQGAVIEMVLATVLTVWLTWVWVKQLTGRRKIAYLTAGILTICYFFANLAGYIYPDMLMAAACVASLIIVQGYYKNLAFQFVLGAILGFALLVHYKTLVFIGLILLILIYQLWRTEQKWFKKIPWLTIIAFLLFGGAYYYIDTYITHGSIAPTLGTSGASVVHGWAIFINFSAMLFDSNKGLLPFNPVLILLFVGLPIWFKLHRKSLIITAIAMAPTIASTAMFIEWHGGYAPTGRYMMDFLPALMPAVAFALIAAKQLWQKWAVGVLSTASLLITLDAMRSHYPLIDPNTWTRHRMWEHIQHITDLPVDKIFPNFITTLPSAGDVTNLIGSFGAIKLAFWYAIVLGLMIYGYLLSRKMNIILERTPLRARRSHSRQTAA